MKVFLLRELAFLLAPVLMLTKLKALASMGIGLLALVVFAIVFAKTLTAFVLQPVGWAWLDIPFGVVVAYIALMFFPMRGE